MTHEEVMLLEKYYHSKDDVERICLWADIEERGIDYLAYFNENCAFCGALKSLRGFQQVILYESIISWKMQNIRPGLVAYRCEECKQKKWTLTAEIKQLQRQSVSCLRDNGMIDDFEKYEIFLNLIAAKRNRVSILNRALNGLVLCHLDNMTDFQVVFSDEKIVRDILIENQETFLARDKWSNFK